MPHKHHIHQKLHRNSNCFEYNYTSTVAISWARSATRGKRLVIVSPLLYGCRFTASAAGADSRRPHPLPAVPSVELLTTNPRNKTTATTTTFAFSASSNCALRQLIRLSLCMSVRHMLALCQNGWIYHRIFSPPDDLIFLVFSKLIAVTFLFCHRFYFKENVHRKFNQRTSRNTFETTQSNE